MGGWSPGRDPLFGCCAAFPSPSFCKSPILCPRSRSSHTQPSTCLGQAAELLASLVPHPPGDALSSQPVFPSTPPTFSSHAQSHRQPCDTAGTLCGLLSFSPRQQGRVSKPRSGRAPRKEREGTKSRAPAQSPPSNGPASRPPLRGRGRAAAWHRACPRPSGASFGEWRLTAGVADGSGRHEEMKSARLRSPPQPLQSQRLMQKVQEAPGYHHVCGNSCHCWAGASAWHLLVTSWVGLASRQRPLTECWMKEAFLLHLCGEKRGGA